MTGVGAGLTVRSSVEVAVWPLELVAVNAMEKVPAAAGVPMIILPILKVRPLGRLVALKVVPTWLEVMV
jgi:hypothetical protein